MGQTAPTVAEAVRDLKEVAPDASVSTVALVKERKWQNENGFPNRHASTPCQL